VLDEYGRGGLYDNWDTTDAERSVLENRENPAWNRSGMISMMEFNGNVQGRILQDYGMVVQDELRDYHVQVWVIGSHVIKAHLSPSPRQRHPYFITSFEKVPGTPVGNGLTDLLADLQESANATLRSLINNLSISSGPQVVINDDMLAPEENGEDLYPMEALAHPKRSDDVERQAADHVLPAGVQRAVADRGVLEVCRDCGRRIGHPEVCRWQRRWRRWSNCLGSSDADGQCLENSADSLGEH
jgi:hypothetical protein